MIYAAPAAPAAAAPAKAEVNAPATIVVTLPADAKLKFDNHLTSSTSATRVFNTPALARNQSYTYTLTAEVVREGQTLTTTKQVTVRGGETTREALEIQAATSVASK